MDIEIRTIAPEELDAWMGSAELAFGDQLDPQELATEKTVVEVERCLVALDGADMVGSAGAYSFELTIPGATVPAGGITTVGVRPSHRRRGINAALMRRQLDDVRDREPVAVLFASEGGIYGRFGYGLGSFMASIDLERDRSAFVRGYEPSGRIRMLERAEALESFLPLIRRTGGARPGAFAIDTRWLDYVYARKHHGEDRRWFFVVHEGEDGADGFAAYLVKHDWSDHMPRSTLELEGLDAVTPSAYADLWRFVLDVDLIHRITAWNRPADEPLLHLLQEPRRARLRLMDGLWVRLVDVPAALAARRYAAGDALVLEVRDRFCPWNEGRVALEGDADGAECGPTDAEPDLVLNVNDLGAAYLGGVSFRDLHRAGRTEERSTGALRRADAMFDWDPAPWCPFMF